MFSKVTEVQSAHSELNKEYEQLKKEVETFKVQIADLRFQMSSKDMECDAAVKVSMTPPFCKFVTLTDVILSRVNCLFSYMKSSIH